MPFVQVKVIEGALSTSQKREIIERVTDAIVAVEGENLRSFTWVTIEEVRSGEWAVGGKPLSAADVRALKVGRPAA